MDYIKVPFGYLMELCCKIFPNYLAALAVFTVILQIILCLAFGIKQQKNSVKQATLAPKIAAIRKKYAGRNDQQTMMKMQEETQALYQAHGYNQLGGCLPMLIQLPIIMGLYYVITEPLRFICGICRTDAAGIKEIIKNFIDAGIASDNLRSQQYEILNYIANNDQSKWIELTNGQIPSVIPEFKTGPFDFSAVPEVASWLVLVPVLIFVTSVLSQIITRKFTYQDPMTKEQQNNPSMKIMMYSMPLLSVWISFSLPAAVGVYWIYRSISATIQQIILYFLMPPPKFTEEDYKAAERELSGKDKNKKKKKETTPRDPNAPKKRSLHHIDDEDEAPAPAVPAPVQRSEEELEKATSEENEPSSLVKEAPVMKDDKGSHYKKK